MFEDIQKSLDKTGLDVGAWYYKYGGVFYGHISAAQSQGLPYFSAPARTLSLKSLFLLS